MRLLMVLVVLVVLALAGLAGFAWFGDMAPRARPMSVPVQLAPVDPASVTAPDSAPTSDAQD